MRLLIIDDNYPNETNLYGDVFAHVRVKEYLKKFPEIIVAASLNEQKPDYNYEGVEVKCVGSIAKLVELIKTFKPDKILIHFATFPIIKGIIFQFDFPYIIWVHGFEALSWHRRLFNFKNPIDFLKYIKGNIVQLYYFRKLIRRANHDKRIHFIFVSEWMRKIAERDCRIKVKNYTVIPNPINNLLFKPERKTAEHRKKLLMIRPFNSRKYGTDIVTNAMQILKSKPFFKDLHFTIYGLEATSSKLYHLFRDYENITIREGFLSQQEIKNLHKDHGIFLSITRQDAQGVSMCEAMSSGLVPITSDNTAIPEFVQHNFSGILTDNQPETVASAIEDLYQHHEKFEEISRNASASIIQKAGMMQIIDQETFLIERIGKTELREFRFSEVEN